MRSLKSELVKLTDSIEFQVRETHASSSSNTWVMLFVWTVLLTGVDGALLCAGPGALQG
jgi:hypothetical protein